MTASTRGPDAAVSGGDLLLEVLESTYVAFRDRVEAIKGGTTCQCNACRLIPALDLEFIVHRAGAIRSGQTHGAWWCRRKRRTPSSRWRPPQRRRTAGQGASNHCLHGKNAAVIQTILDRRPFDYFTYSSRDSDKPEPDMLLTYEIIPTTTGSRLDVRLKLLVPGPDFAKRMLAKVMLARYHIADHYTRLAALAK